jgi:SnoaL-like domain
MKITRRNVASWLALGPIANLAASPARAKGAAKARTVEETCRIKSACSDLSIRYTHCIADRTFAGFDQVFSPDGMLEVQGNRLVGPEAIGQFLATSIGTGESGVRVRLVITNELIEVRDGRNATGRAFFAIYRFDVSNGPKVPSLAPAAFATSDDAYVLTPAGWRMALRKIALLAVAG